MQSVSGDGKIKAGYNKNTNKIEIYDGQAKISYEWDGTNKEVHVQVFPSGRKIAVWAGRHFNILEKTRPEWESTLKDDFISDITSIAVSDSEEDVSFIHEGRFSVYRSSSNGWALSDWHENILSQLNVVSHMALSNAHIAERIILGSKEGIEIWAAEANQWREKTLTNEAKDMMMGEAPNGLVAMSADGRTAMIGLDVALGDGKIVKDIRVITQNSDGNWVLAMRRSNVLSFGFLGDGRMFVIYPDYMDIHKLTGPVDAIVNFPEGIKGKIEAASILSDGKTLLLKLKGRDNMVLWNTNAEPMPAPQTQEVQRLTGLIQQMETLWKHYEELVAVQEELGKINEEASSELPEKTAAPKAEALPGPAAGADEIVPVDMPWVQSTSADGKVKAGIADGKFYVQENNGPVYSQGRPGGMDEVLVFPDGKTILTWDGWSVYQWTKDAQGNWDFQSAINRSSSESIQDIVVSPDGKAVAVYGHRGAKGRVRVYDTDNWQSNPRQISLDVKHMEFIDAGWLMLGTDGDVWGWNPSSGSGEIVIRESEIIDTLDKNQKIKGKVSLSSNGSGLLVGVTTNLKGKSNEGVSFLVNDGVGHWNRFWHESDVLDFRFVNSPGSSMHGKIMLIFKDRIEILKFDEPLTTKERQINFPDNIKGKILEAKLMSNGEHLRLKIKNGKKEEWTLWQIPQEQASPVPIATLKGIPSIGVVSMTKPKVVETSDDLFTSPETEGLEQKLKELGANRVFSYNQEGEERLVVADKDWKYTELANRNHQWVQLSDAEKKLSLVLPLRGFLDIFAYEHQGEQRVVTIGGDIEYSYRSGRWVPLVHTEQGLFHNERFKDHVYRGMVTYNNGREPRWLVYGALGATDEVRINRKGEYIEASKQGSLSQKIKEEHKGKRIRGVISFNFGGKQRWLSYGENGVIAEYMPRGKDYVVDRSKNSLAAFLKRLHDHSENEVFKVFIYEHKGEQRVISFGGNGLSLESAYRDGRWKFLETSQDLLDMLDKKIEYLNSNGVQINSDGLISIARYEHQGERGWVFLFKDKDDKRFPIVIAQKTLEAQPQAVQTQTPVNVPSPQEVRVKQLKKQRAALEKKVERAEEELKRMESAPINPVPVPVSASPGTSYELLPLGQRPMPVSFDEDIVGVSRNGKIFLVLPGDKKTLYIKERQPDNTLKEVKHFEGDFSKAVFAMSDDGNVIGGYSGNENYIIRNVMNEGWLKNDFLAHVTEYSSVAVSPDGKRVAFGNKVEAEREYEIVNVNVYLNEQNRVILEKDLWFDKDKDKEATITDLKFSSDGPDGQTLVAACPETKAFYVWTRDANGQWGEVNKKGVLSKPFKIAILPNRHLIIGVIEQPTSDRYCALEFKLQKGEYNLYKLVGLLNHHPSNAIDASPDGQRVLISNDKEKKIFRYENGGWRLEDAISELGPGFVPQFSSDPRYIIVRGEHETYEYELFRPAQGPAQTANPAQMSSPKVLTPGGIDLNANHFGLEVRADGNRISQQITDRAMGRQGYPPIKGLVPIILSITPMPWPDELTKLSN